MRAGAGALNDGELCIEEANALTPVAIVAYFVAYRGMQKGGGGRIRGHHRGICKLVSLLWFFLPLCFIMLLLFFTVFVFVVHTVHKYILRNRNQHQNHSTIVRCVGAFSDGRMPSYAPLVVRSSESSEK